jgi:hypothetical protein
LAWERRGSGQFYYRSRRVRGQVVREYVGGGEKGRRAAESDRAVSEARRRVVRLRAENRRPVDKLAARMDQFDIMFERLVVCQLACAGWKHYRREWRAPKRWR